MYTEYLESIFSRMQLLIKPIWENSDIQDFTGCGETMASKIHRKAAAEKNGLILLLPKKVKRDAVLELLEIDPKEEFERISGLFKEMTKMMSMLKESEM